MFYPHFYNVSSNTYIYLPFEKNLPSNNNYDLFASVIRYQTLNINSVLPSIQNVYAYTFGILHRRRMYYALVRCI